jgi:hypothetical protein
MQRREAILNIYRRQVDSMVAVSIPMRKPRASLADEAIGTYQTVP